MIETQEYSISDLAHYTGIKPHTIRIWEKRYQLFSPRRSDTNIRAYDNQALRKLINIKSLLEAGWKISNVVSLSNTEFDSEIKQIGESKNENCTDFLVNSLMVHMIGFDEEKFAIAIDQAINEFGLKKAILQVVYPFLKRVGLLWQVNDISPAQEHFASSIIRRKVLKAIDNIQISTNSKYTFILCLPPNEYHDLPLLLAYYILKENGIKTIYLGSSVSPEIAAMAGKKTGATHLFTLFLSNSPMEKLKEYLVQIHDQVPTLQISFSGNPMICQKSKLNDHVTHLADIDTFERMVKDLVPNHS